MTSEWYTTEDIEEGTAVSTDPAAGSELNSGSEVTLYVAHSRGTELVDLTREILPGALRVKGILSDTEHGWFHVDGVNDKVETRVLEASGNESKIVIIPKAGDEIAEKLIAAWNTQCRVPFSLS